MKRRTLQHLVPSLIMAGAAAVPVATTVEILTHTPGSSTTAFQPSAPIAMAPPRTSPRVAGASAPTSSGSSQTFQGSIVHNPFGGVQATITVAKRKIANVVISAPQDNPTSAGINQQALPLLQRETLQAQSAQLNTVSGATYTSQAYARSLQAALDRARSQGNAVAGTPNSSQMAASASHRPVQAPSVSVAGDE